MLTAMREIAAEWWEGMLRVIGRREMTLGERGERFAAKFLRKQGMRIIARNRRRGKGEIDLIALEGNWVVFVEVRTRSSEEFMSPEGSVRHGKRKTVTKTVRRMMRRHVGKGFTARIDLVAVIWPEGAREPTVVRHHKGAMAVGW